MSTAARATHRLLPVLLAVSLSACAVHRPPMDTVDFVDIERFMGDWYVIANIPTFLEKGAHNAVESYALNPDGSIATDFRFREGSFDGERKHYTPSAIIRDPQSNAEWGMRFVWPFRADYRIVYLNEDYTQTVIARVRRDYVWIMARTPSIPEADYERLLGRVTELGYDPDQVRKVPQRW